METLTGTITEIDPRLFGWIRSPRGRHQRVFFHVTELWELPFTSALIGQPVCFEFGRTQYGRCATNVRPIDMPAV